MDTRTREQRRRIMQAVRSPNTGSEITLRRLLHRFGYPYRLHRKDLPGIPDFIFVMRRKAIFVHGCLWHGHGCPKGSLPEPRLDYWEPELNRNTERDRPLEKQLRSLGYSVLVVRQCEAAELGSLDRCLQRFIGDSPARPPIVRGHRRIKSTAGDERGSGP